MFLIVLSSLFTLYFYYLIFDNALLGIVVLTLSLLLITNHFGVDKRYKEFIETINEVEYANIEEALEEYREDKKYLIKLFNKENTKVLENFKKLKVTHREFDRFIEIQKKKNEFIDLSIKKRIKAYAISLFIYLLSFLPLLYSKNNNPIFYYKLYNGGYYVLIFLSIVFIIVNNINLKFLNKNNFENLNLYDNYSLCFHKNCQKLLEINDDRLKYDIKGNIVDVDFDIKEKNNYSYSLLSFFLSIMVSIYFMI